MASNRERIDASGKKKYHVQIRLKGFPPQTETFDSKTVAKQWAQRVETELREGRYMPRAVAQRRYSVLVSDINLSLDDRYLYVSCWGTGELLQYDVSDPLAPVLAGKVQVGGIVARTAHPGTPTVA